MFTRSMSPSPPTSMFVPVCSHHLSNAPLGPSEPHQASFGAAPRITRSMDISPQSNEIIVPTPEQLSVMNAVHLRIQTYQPHAQIPSVNPNKKWEDPESWRVFRLVKDGKALEWPKGKAVQALGLNAKQKKVFEDEIEELVSWCFPRIEEWTTPFTPEQRSRLLQEMVDVMKQRWGPAFNIPYWKCNARLDHMLSDLLRRTLRPSVRKRKTPSPFLDRGLDDASVIPQIGGKPQMLASGTGTPCPPSRTQTPASQLTFPSPSLRPQNPLVTQFESLRWQTPTPTPGSSFDFNPDALTDATFTKTPEFLLNATFVKTPPKYEQWDTVISIHNHLTQAHILTLNILEVQQDSAEAGGAASQHFTHGAIMNIDEAKFLRMVKDAAPDPAHTNFKLRLFLPGHLLHGELRTEVRGLKYLVQIAYNARSNPIVFTVEWVRDDGRVVGIAAEGAWKVETGKG